jgi:hypothetical protein
MSETINYTIRAKNFKDETQKVAFCVLAQSWDNGNFNDWACDSRIELNFHYSGGWRGGGQTCAELINEHFGLFLEQNPNVHFKATAEYVEQAPIETEVEKGEW